MEDVRAGKEERGSCCSIGIVSVLEGDKVPESPYTMYI
jgi:hypothetical protein